MIACCLCLGLAARGQAQTEAEQLKSALAQDPALSTSGFEQLGDRRPSLADRDLCLAVIYHATGIEPLWVSASGPGARAAIILGFLENSDREGLAPQEYGIDQITGLWHATTPASLARLDTLLTYNLVKYIYDMNYGRIPPSTAALADVTSDTARTFDIVAAVKAARAAPDLQQYLTALAPAHHFYQDLKAALKVYTAIARSGGWGQIPAGKTLNPEEHDDRLPAIRERLIAPGIASVPRLTTDVYGPALVNAVKRFQQLFGITPDGVIGPQTLAAMNIPASILVKKIVINMARWRRQAHILGDKFVMINIADFTLTAYKGNDMVLSLPVVIGKLHHQTPVFSSSITYVQFNPYWIIPPSIAENEELLHLRKNRRYLVEKHIRLYSGRGTDAVELDSTKINWHEMSPQEMRSFRLRQDPGAWNALGRIKFAFPNPYGVYVHDTPEKDLFSRNTRDSSHGCIRLSNPLALADFVLEDQGKGWTPDKIESAFYADRRTTVWLNSPLPIHITYQTTWVDKDGAIHFNRDIYARDETLYKALIQNDSQ